MKILSMVNFELQVRFTSVPTNSIGLEATYILSMHACEGCGVKTTTSIVSQITLVLEQYPQSLYSERGV